MNNEHTKRSYINDIHEVARLIPEGRVSSYGAIANYLETVTARMVGWAMNKSRLAERPVPAHRVVNRKGELSGRNFFETPTMMQELLEAENIEVVDNKIQDFKTLFWDPAKELG